MHPVVAPEAVVRDLPGLLPAGGARSVPEVACFLLEAPCGQTKESPDVTRTSARKLELLALALMLGTGSAALSGCEEGPMEETGEEVDDAVDEAEDEVD